MVWNGCDPAKSEAVKRLERLERLDSAATASGIAQARLLISEAAIESRRFPSYRLRAQILLPYCIIVLHHAA